MQVLSIILLMASPSFSQITSIRTLPGGTTNQIQYNVGGRFTGIQGSGVSGTEVALGGLQVTSTANVRVELTVGSTLQRSTWNPAGLTLKYGIDATTGNFSSQNASGFSLVLSSGISASNGVFVAKEFRGDGSLLTSILASAISAGSLGAGVICSSVAIVSVGPAQLVNTAVTAGAYGSSNQSVSLTFDADGRATSASEIYLTTSSIAYGLWQDNQVTLSTGAITSGKFGDTQVLISSAAIINGTSYTCTGSEVALGHVVAGGITTAGTCSTAGVGDVIAANNNAFNGNNTHSGQESFSSVSTITFAAGSVINISSGTDCRGMWCLAASSDTVAFSTISFTGVDPSSGAFYEMEINWSCKWTADCLGYIRFNADSRKTSYNWMTMQETFTPAAQAQESDNGAVGSIWCPMQYSTNNHPINTITYNNAKIVIDRQNNKNALVRWTGVMKNGTIDQNVLADGACFYYGDSAITSIQFTVQPGSATANVMLMKLK